MVRLRDSLRSRVQTMGSSFSRWGPMQSRLKGIFKRNRTTENSSAKPTDLTEFNNSQGTADELNRFDYRSDVNSTFVSRQDSSASSKLTNMSTYVDAFEWQPVPERTKHSSSKAEPARVMETFKVSVLIRDFPDFPKDVQSWEWQKCYVDMSCHCNKALLFLSENRETIVQGLRQGHQVLLPDRSNAFKTAEEKWAEEWNKWTEWRIFLDSFDKDKHD